MEIGVLQELGRGAVPSPSGRDEAALGKDFQYALPLSKCIQHDILIEQPLLEGCGTGLTLRLQCCGSGRIRLFETPYPAVKRGDSRLLALEVAVRLGQVEDRRYETIDDTLATCKSRESI